jgi:hypothetical protein
VAGTMPTAPGAFAAALAGRLSETGTIGATPGAFASSMAGTATPPPVSGTIVAIPGLFVMAAAGSVPVRGAMVTPMGTIVTLLAGTNGALVTLGTVALTDRAVTTIALSDTAVTTIALTITDETGAALNSYMVGTVVRLNALIKNISSALVDAGSVTVKIKPPSGTFTPVTPTHDGTGTYHYDYEPALALKHVARVEATNPDAAEEIEIWIKPSGVL